MHSDLKDNATLLDSFNATTRRKRLVLTNCQANLLNVFVAAERALEIGDNPVALFAHFVGEHQWQLISSEQEDRAKQRLRRLRNPESNCRRDRDADDGAISEPVAVGDIVRNFISQFQSR